MRHLRTRLPCASPDRRCRGGITCRLDWASTIGRIFVAAVVLCWSSAANAYPYKLYAKYEIPTSGTSKVVTVDLDLVGSTLVPTDPIGGKFKGIYLLPKSDPIAQVELNRLDRIVVDLTTECPEASCQHVTTVTVLPDAIHALSPSEQLIFAPQPIGVDLPLTSLTMEVRPKFTATYLCDMERQLRQDAGKRIKLNFPASPTEQKQAALKAKPKPETTDKGRAAETLDIDPTSASIITARDGKKSAYAYATLLETGLATASGAPILYSFCRNVHDEVDWDVVAQLSHAGAGSLPDREAAHAEHKARLVALLTPRIERDTKAAVEPGRHADEPRDNVYALLRHRITFLTSMSHFGLFEVTASEVQPLVGITDKSSRIKLALLPGSGFCSSITGCNTVIGKVLVATIGYTDKKGNPVKKESALEPDGNEWEVAPNLSENIGDEITITVSYVAGDDRLDLLTRKTKVENLGLITTFPVVSEVISAVTKNASNPADLSVQSSIPISWGINLSHAEAAHVAVTFPWMFGFNTRSGPHLADVIKVFPHVTLIFPLKSETEIRTTRVAFGGGVALANAFTFSAAATVQDTPQAFFLIGISAPDLAKAFAR
jgi:hypothetical protein